MRYLHITIISIIALLPNSGGAFAGERTVVLAVENMACVVCAYNVKRALEAVPGVSNVEVTLRKSNAVVVYDDAKVHPDALTSATARAGFRSSVRD